MSRGVDADALARVMVCIEAAVRELHDAEAQLRACGVDAELHLRGPIQDALWHTDIAATAAHKYRRTLQQ